MATITEKIEYWHSQFLPYHPSWSTKDFMTNMNVLEVTEWYPELDQSFTRQLELEESLNMKKKWFEKFQQIFPNMIFNDFVEKYDLETVFTWNVAIDNKLELMYYRAMKSYTFTRINEWVKKFQEYEPEMTRENFVKIHNIHTNTLWNNEIEESVQAIYSKHTDIERLQWFTMFVTIWPGLSQEHFFKLFDADTDFQSTFDTAFLNIELFCKLMDLSYHNSIDKSYNMMIHELGITIEQHCNETLDAKIIKVYRVMP